MLVKNTRHGALPVPEAHGYGAFCIGDNEVIYDNCDVDVYGYPLLMMGMEGKGKAAILNSRIKGRRYGVMINGDDNSVLTIKDSDFKTGKSTFCVHGASTIIDVENTSMTAANGTIVQLMDTDQCGMAMADFHIPVGVVDEYVEGQGSVRRLPDRRRHLPAEELCHQRKLPELHHQYPRLPQQCDRRCG